MILSFINISKVPRKGFPWDLENVNEWKIMFNPVNIEILLNILDLNMQISIAV